MMTKFVTIVSIFCISVLSLSCVDSLYVKAVNSSTENIIWNIDPYFKKNFIAPGMEREFRKRLFTRGATINIVKQEKTFKYKFSDFDHWLRQTHKIFIQIDNDSIIVKNIGHGDVKRISDGIKDVVFTRRYRLWH